MLNDILGNKYRVLSQTPPPAPPPAGQTVGTPTATFGKGGLFGDVKAGDTGTYRGFTATNSGPGLPAVVSGTGTPFGMMDTLRTQGYTPAEATAAVAAGYGAGVDQVNTRLRPAESASNIGLNTSSVGLNNANAFTVRAQGAEVAANAASTRNVQAAQARSTNASALSEEQLTQLFRTDPEAYRAAIGLQPLGLSAGGRNGGMSRARPEFSLGAP
jgi:hypothetical protein